MRGRDTSGKFLFVILAKAGIQDIGELFLLFWIPASAGMTRIIYRE